MRFNPCCIGLDNDAELSHQYRSQTSSGFNPCCIGLDNDAPRVTGPPHTTSRFNPCCIGLDNDAGDALQQVGLEVGFQSLLYWIGQ